MYILMYEVESILPMLSQPHEIVVAWHVHLEGLHEST
jgi:hypothetical protein